MEAKDIRKFFPKECHITQKLIDSGNCIGTYLLKSFLPSELWEDMFWGLSIGTIKGVKIKTEETIIYKDKKHRVALYLDSHIKDPRDIIFELR